MTQASGDNELRPMRWRQRGAHLRAFLSVFVLAFVFMGLMYNTAAAQTFDDGVHAFDSDDFERAAKIWEPLAQQGHVLSQYNIGLLHENGLGVPRRPDLAFFWYRMAALNGNDEARYNLGGLYFRGEGVDRSIEQAAQVWTESANAGNPNAAYNLGVILVGDGSDEEGLRAGMIRLKQASDAGHPNATVLLQSLSRVARVPESLFFSIAPEVPAIEELAMPTDPLPTPELPPQADASVRGSADYRTTTGLAYGDDARAALEIGRRWIELQPDSRYTVKVFSFYEADVALWYLKQWGFGGPGAIYLDRGEIHLAIGSFESRGIANGFLSRLRQHVPGVAGKKQAVVRFASIRPSGRLGG